MKTNAHHYYTPFHNDTLVQLHQNKHISRSRIYGRLPWLSLLAERKGRPFRNVVWMPTECGRYHQPACLDTDVGHNNGGGVGSKKKNYPSDVTTHTGFI